MADEGTRVGGALTRRSFVAGAAGAAALAWAPLGRIPAAVGAPGTPPGFPRSIELGRQTFENWAQEFVVDDLWTAVPRSSEEVVRLANWAHKAGWRLRPRGHMHGWSPFIARPGMKGQNRTVLLDTTRYMAGVLKVSHSPPSVTALAGASMDQIVEAIKPEGYSLAATAAVGAITLGGVLAIDAHGTSMTGRGEELARGHSNGTLSNLVMSLTAVVWDRKKKRYVLKRFDRDDPECKALMVCLGRTFITEATLQLGPERYMRCQSITDVSIDDLFAAPGSRAPNQYREYLDESGRSEIIWYPFTDKPWLKVWSVAKTPPPGVRPVNRAYNYPFSDSIPVEVTTPAGQLLTGNTSVTPLFGQVMYAATVAGLAAGRANDIWGHANDLSRYVKAYTLRYTALGSVVLTKRERIQEVLGEMFHFTRDLADAYAARGEYPLNGPLEIRCTGLDHARDSVVEGAETPVLSALRARKDRNWDAAIWFDVLTLPGSPHAQRFLREIEQHFIRSHRGGKTSTRFEWSKGWAYSGTDGWADKGVLRRDIPRIFSQGRKPGDDWDWATGTLDRLDPHRVFSNAFLDRFLH
jgi:hypothetical protein